MSSKEPTYQWRECKRGGKIPWRRTWQPTPVFLPGESHGHRSLAGSIGSQRVGHDWSDLTSHAILPMRLLIPWELTALSYLSLYSCCLAWCLIIYLFFIQQNWSAQYVPGTSMAFWDKAVNKTWNLHAPQAYILLTVADNSNHSDKCNDDSPECIIGEHGKGIMLKIWEIWKSLQKKASQKSKEYLKNRLKLARKGGNECFKKYSKFWK